MGDVVRTAFYRDTADAMGGVAAWRGRTMEVVNDDDQIAKAYFFRDTAAAMNGVAAWRLRSADGVAAPDTRVLIHRIYRDTVNTCRARTQTSVLPVVEDECFGYQWPRFVVSSEIACSYYENEERWFLLESTFPRSIVMEYSVCGLRIEPGNPCNNRYVVIYEPRRTDGGYTPIPRLVFCFADPPRSGDAVSIYLWGFGATAQCDLRPVVSRWAYGAAVILNDPGQNKPMIDWGTRIAVTYRGQAFDVELTANAGPADQVPYIDRDGTAYYYVTQRTIDVCGFTKYC